MTVEIVKGTKRLSFAKKIICQRALPYKTLLLLPIPTTKDGVHVNGTDITLESLTVGLSSECAVAGYGFPTWFSERLASLGARVYDAMYDESFQVKNAELTALGVLGNVLSAKERAPSEVCFGIIGYGRIGSALTKYLRQLGANPIVFTSRESVRAFLGKAGIRALCSDSIEDYASVDVLINTAPKRILDSGGVAELSDAGVALFDLASGENFDGSPLVARLGGVPDKVFPESAGRAYADALCRTLGGL